MRTKVRITSLFTKKCSVCIDILELPDGKD